MSFSKKVLKTWEHLEPIRNTANHAYFHGLENIPIRQHHFAASPQLFFHRGQASSTSPQIAHSISFSRRSLRLNGPFKQVSSPISPSYLCSRAFFGFLRLSRKPQHNSVHPLSFILLSCRFHVSTCFSPNFPYDVYPISQSSCAHWALPKIRTSSFEVSDPVGRNSLLLQKSNIKMPYQLFCTSSFCELCTYQHRIYFPHPPVKIGVSIEIEIGDAGRGTDSFRNRIRFSKILWQPDSSIHNGPLFLVETRQGHGKPIQYFSSRRSLDICLSWIANMLFTKYPLTQFHHPQWPPNSGFV